MSARPIWAYLQLSPCYGKLYVFEVFLSKINRVGNLVYSIFQRVSFCCKTMGNVFFLHTVKTYKCVHKKLRRKRLWSDNYYIAERKWMTVVHKTVFVNCDLSTEIQIGYCQYYNIVHGRKSQVVLQHGKNLESSRSLIVGNTAAFGMS